jgi:nucleoside-diphosphate-sugar epimerase
MVKILITGAAGFIGANLTRKLIKTENETNILIKETSDLWRINDIISNCNVHKIDLKKVEDVKKIVKKINPELVYHCAGHGIYPSQKDSAEIFSTNILGTFNLLAALNESNNLRRLVNLGSFFEYSTNPIDPYTISKITQTKLVEHFFKEKKLPVITLRLFTPYGKFDSPGRLICDLMIAIIRNKPLEIFSKYTKRDLIYIDDVITALETASQQSNIDGEIIDIGTGNETSVEEIVNISNQLSGNDLTINWNDKKQHEIDISGENIFLGRQKMQKLNWKPCISLEVGLRKTIEWYKQNINLYSLL